MGLLDYITAVGAWLIFWFYRQHTLNRLLPDIYPPARSFYFRDYLLSYLIIPLFWLFLYYLSGTYFDLYKKSRLIEVFRTFISALIGSLMLGMVGFANDTDSFIYFFEITAYYFCFHLGITLLARLILLYKIKNDLIRKKVRFNTLIIGSNGKGIEIYHQLMNDSHVLGNYIKGIVRIHHQQHEEIQTVLPDLGNIDQLEQIIDRYRIEEVILGVASREHQMLEEILIRLSYRPVTVKVLPDLYDILSGTVRISNVLAPVMISINPELLPDWQKTCKRAIDVFVALFGFVVCAPIFIIAAIMVRLSSSGPIFYLQERIGLFGRPFKIIKFRSMFQGSEVNGPALSSDKDPRITRWGRVMRKWRIDELPQFYNVLRGDMSLVGPRPERAHFINKIIKKKPVYKYLHRVKPGITSWGMVQFGYAENVDQMIQRMKYDLLYIQNCSLALDLKIIFYTIKVLLQGRGK